MKPRSGVLFLWALFISVGLACQAAAFPQESGQTQEKEPVDTKTTTRIALGGSSGAPGTSVVVPIYFTPAEGVQVGRLSLDVSFVSVNMKFDKIERGVAAELGDVDLKNELKIGKNDKGVETSTLLIRAAAPEKKPIPSGLLGYITLNISATGRPANITMKVTAEGEDLDSKPLTKLRAYDAEVEVLAPGTQPAVACFFFSH